MLVDLNLQGKDVLVLGGGREATRKLQGILSQANHILLQAGSVTPAIQQWADEGRLELRLELMEELSPEGMEHYYLVMAVTDDKLLNRKFSNMAREKGCWVYCVDDPEFSDFSHPSVIRPNDSVALAISTGGKSPLMARVLRERLESRLKEWIDESDYRMIELQHRLRTQAKVSLGTPQERKQFLESVFADERVNELLSRDQVQLAEERAWLLLSKHD